MKRNQSLIQVVLNYCHVHDEITVSICLLCIFDMYVLSMLVRVFVYSTEFVVMQALSISETLKMLVSPRSTVIM